jgi:thioesterase domain-containing protein
VGVNDNFFGVGGDLWAADRLFAGIVEEKEFGRELPSSTIYRAPTIAELAQVLQQAGLPTFCPLVELKPGSKLRDGESPICIVHGLAGTVPFYGLAQQIQTADPIYGIQAQGLDGMTEPLDRIEDMAQLYLDSLNKLGRHGPFILIGYSFGGLVALEMAQRMLVKGSPAAMLILIDAYPHSRHLSREQRFLLSARRAPGRIARLSRRLLRAASPDSTSAASASVPLPRSFARTTLKVNEKSRIALEHYEPRFYPLKINFVKSAGDTYFPANPAHIWERLSAEFECETVPGEHLEMVTTNYDGVAVALTRYLNRMPVSLRR